MTTGHHVSCRVSIPSLRVGLSRLNEFGRRAGSCHVIVIGNVARPGSAGFGVWPGRVKLVFAESVVWPGWVLSCWLTQANAYTFPFSQALLHDPRQIVCPDLYAFQIALTGTRPGFARFSQVQVCLGSCKFQFRIGFGGFCVCGSRVLPHQFVGAVLRGRS